MSRYPHVPYRRDGDTDLRWNRELNTPTLPLEIGLGNRFAGENASDGYLIERRCREVSHGEGKRAAGVIPLPILKRSRADRFRLLVLDDHL